MWPAEVINIEHLMKIWDILGIVFLLRVWIFGEIWKPFSGIGGHSPSSTKFSTAVKRPGLEDIFKTTLVEQRGFGKLTDSWKVCRVWDVNQLLHSSAGVILLEVRNRGKVASETLNW